MAVPAYLSWARSPAPCVWAGPVGNERVHSETSRDNWILETQNHSKSSRQLIVFAVVEVESTSVGSANTIRNPRKRSSSTVCTQRRDSLSSQIIKFESAVRVQTSNRLTWFFVWQIQLSGVEFERRLFTESGFNGLDENNAEPGRQRAVNIRRCDLLYLSWITLTMFTRGMQPDYLTPSPIGKSSWTGVELALWKIISFWSFQIRSGPARLEVFIWGQFVCNKSNLVLLRGVFFCMRTYSLLYNMGRFCS